MFKNKGDKYEALVQYVYQELLNENNSGLSNIKVMKNYKVKGKSNVVHDIDVYYEFILNDITHKVIIECKNWNTKVTKEKVLALQSILNDIPGSVGVMISNKGFQPKAIEYANFRNINLIKANEISLLGKTLSAKLKKVLPDDNAKGEPFYCVMEYDEIKEHLTGNYICASSNGKDPYIILCFSKLEADELTEIYGGVVRGITKKHLEILCDYEEHHSLNLAIKTFLKPEYISVNSKLIKDYFLY